MKTIRGFIRSMLLFSVLVLSPWLLTSQAWAVMQPTFVACDPGQPNKSGPTCTNVWSVYHGSRPFSSLIGYVDQTQLPGTTPVYLTCTLNPPLPKAAPSCANHWYIAGSANTPFADFIGYVYTSQIAGTVPMYLTCNLEPPIPKAGPRCENSWYVTSTPDPNAASFTSFIGYVYFDPPVSIYTFPSKYFIGSVVYVPPGQASTIGYSAGTVTGTTVSTSQSWNDSASISITADVPNSKGGSAGNLSLTVGQGFSGSSTTSIDVQSTNTQGVTYQGPSSNSINHDYDQVLIYLGVNFVAKVDYLGNINWSVDFSQIAAQGYAMTGYPITVGCLRPNSTVSATVCAATLNFLSSVGITAADYAGILNADPFWDPGASQSLDRQRFVLIDSMDFLPNPTTPKWSYSLNNSSSVTNLETRSYSWSYSLGFSLPILKISDTFTLTESSSTSNKTGSTDASTFMLSMPSAPYSGPSTLFVYVDTIYKTFMFSFQQ